MKIDVIGVPVDLGADRRGVDMGPSAIRYAHLNQGLEALGYTVEDRGNVEVPIAERCAITDPKLKYLDCILPMARRVAGAVATSVQEGSFPLVLGGDHSLSLGSIRGAARHKKLGVLWIDAHADFNTPETTRSGFLDGMALSVLTGRCWRGLAETIPGFRPVAPGSVLLVGARDLDPAEAAMLDEAGVARVGPGDPAAIQAALDHLRGRVERVYLHLDLDVVDPSLARANAFAAPGGLGADELLSLLRGVRERFTVVAAALSAYDPEHDPAGALAPLAARALLEIAAPLP